MRPCVKQRPRHILASSCSEGGLGRTPSSVEQNELEMIKLDVSTQNLEY
jgi:hypothetical protein